VLIVAGSDSGGGAGIQADIKTITMLGGFATTAITAITAQNTLGVQAVMPVPAEMVVAQIDAVVSDIGVDAVKIGMIGSPQTAEAVADRLELLAVPIVFDPVMVATSGSVLADPATIAAFERLMRIAALVTPNTQELEALSGIEIRSEVDQGLAAGLLIERGGCRAVLAKGGHFPGGSVHGRDGRGKPFSYKTDNRVFDTLYWREDGDAAWQDCVWDGDRIETKDTHGTGCTLASAIAVGLGEGLDLGRAIQRARLFVRIALREAPGLGAGHGPMGHHRVRLDLPDREGPTLNQVTLPAGDYQASAAFYQLLGCRQIVASPPRYARFEVPGGATLSIELRDPPDAPSTTEHFFQCVDVDAEVERLIAAGIVFDIMPEDRDYLWRVAETRDPHGNRICLYQTGEIRRFPPWRID
jgi:hydroxymethylpyrimidine/phosphomethylpyrimidine kinase